MKKDAFLQIIREHKKLIFKICHTYCNNKDNHKDLEQEILLQLWKSMDRFNGKVKLSTWIYKVALNTAIAFYKKDQKHNNKRVQFDQALLSLPDESFEKANENLPLLHQFISELSDGNKALILLYLDEYKYQEIAEILGISTTNVATKLNRIKNTFKEKFQQQKTENHGIG